MTCFKPVHFILSPPFCCGSVTYARTRGALFDSLGVEPTTPKLDQTEAQGKPAVAQFVPVSFMLSFPSSFIEVISSKRWDLLHFQVMRIRQQQCKYRWYAWTTAVVWHFHGNQWSEFLTFHPALWWCNHRMGCWWNWCWLQPVAFHPRSPLVREWHKRGCVQTEKCHKKKKNLLF